MASKWRKEHAEKLLTIPMSNDFIFDDIRGTILRHPDYFTKMASKAKNQSVLQAICHLSLLAQGVISTLTLYNIWNTGVLKRAFGDNEDVTDFVIVRLYNMIWHVDSGERKNKMLDPLDRDVLTINGAQSTGFGFDNITSGGHTKGKYLERFEHSDIVKEFLTKNKFKQKMLNQIEITMRNLKEAHAKICRDLKIEIDHFVDLYHDPFEHVLCTCPYLEHSGWMSLLELIPKRGERVNAYSVLEIVERKSHPLVPEVAMTILQAYRHSSTSAPLRSGSNKTLEGGKRPTRHGSTSAPSVMPKTVYNNARNNSTSKNSNKNINPNAKKSNSAVSLAKRKRDDSSNSASSATDPKPDSKRSKTAVSHDATKSKTAVLDATKHASQTKFSRAIQSIKTCNITLDVLQTVFPRFSSHDSHDNIKLRVLPELQKLTPQRVAQWTVPFGEITRTLPPSVTGLFKYNKKLETKMQNMFDQFGALLTLHCGLIVDETHKPDKDRICCCPLAAVNISYLKTDRNLQCNKAGIKRFTVSELMEHAKNAHKSHNNVFYHLLRGYLEICHPDLYAPGKT